MKSVRIDKEAKEKYPYLGEYKHGALIILFIDKRTGVVIQSGSDSWKVGEYSVVWGEANFAPYDGKVELENGEY